MIRLAIDLGSSTTKIYRADAGNGVVLVEPSCVAVDVDHEIKAIGKEAKKLLGKTTAQTHIVFPVFEGVIVDNRLAAVMLKEFLSRVGSPVALKRARIVFSVPCGANEEVLESYALLAEECGLKKVAFVEAPYLAALGSGIALSEENPLFCLDIGGGVTNAAVLSLGGIIAGLSMNIGGYNMDKNIQLRVQRLKGIEIGDQTAERIKNEIGSLQERPHGSTVASGVSSITRAPGSESVSALEISDCIRVYMDKILEYALLVLQKLPAEVAASVNKNGVCLTGGVARVKNVAEYVSKKLGGLRVHVCEEPQFAVVTGGGAVARDKQLFELFYKG